MDRGYARLSDKKGKTEKGGRQMAANSEKTARGRGRPFQKGQSGNPKGRPKQTPEQKDALQQIRALAPAAADRLREIINDPETKLDIQLRAIDIVLDRAYGKAAAQVNVSTGSFDALEDAFAALKGDDDQ